MRLFRACRIVTDKPLRAERRQSESRKLMKHPVCALVFVIAALLMAPARGEVDPAARGLQIATEMHGRDSNFGNYRVDMDMTLRDRQGQSSTRRIRAAVLEVVSGGDKSRLVFDAPADLRGTVFLSFAHSDRADDQWLYLPSLKRTRRIASESKAGSFMGSEFAFEDITAQELMKFSYSFSGTDTLESRQALKIERVPRYEGSGYVRQTVWVDAERYVPLKVEFFDRRNALQKTLVYGGYQLQDGRFWEPDSMDMVNHQTGKSTTIQFSNYRYRSDLSAQDFDPQRLENER
jgi:outer membrane lipoprotein-sorting protein